MPVHTVRQGESVMTLAKRWSVHPDSIWEHPDNADLKERRKNPFVLKPGDTLTIPDPDEREESVATERVHEFVLSEPRAKLAVRLLSEGEPREGEWVLDVDGEDVADGDLDDGWVRAEVPATAESAKIFLWPKRDEEEGAEAEGGESGGETEGDEDEDDDEPLVFKLRLHHLDPHDELSGVKQRLQNLGFLHDVSEEGLGPMTQAALFAFQHLHDLDVTGEADDATIGKLREKHG